MTQKKNTLTRECIFTALLLLMEQKPYEEITITDIARKAGVSRMSYYRMYKSKDDILIQYFNDIFEECLEQIKSMEEMDRFLFTLLIFRTAREYHQLIECLLHAELHTIVLQCFIRYCTYLAEHVFAFDMSDIRVDYWIYGEAGRFSQLIFRWVERGMQETPEEMAKMAVKDFFRKI